MMKNNSKLIQLLGVGLPNRGAELMARTVIEQFRCRFDKCIFCLDQEIAYDHMDPLGMIRTYKNNARISENFQFKMAHRGRKLARHRKVDAIVDVSGFAYGDFWGVKKTIKRLTQNIPYWQKHKKPLFILPQAFGPFSDDGFKNSLLPALEYASMVCVRDAQSMDHIKNLGYKSAKQYPDITFSLADIAQPVAHIGSKKFSLIIPNSKIVQSGVLTLEQYLRMIKNVATNMSREGSGAFTLNHEGTADRDICHKIKEELGLECFEPTNALEAKTIISRADMVFTSRFHGMISSLVVGVPPIVFGWTHKYNEVMKEFGLLEYLLGDHNVDPSSLITDLQNPIIRDPIIEQIRENTARMKSRLQEMWDDLFSQLV